MTEKTLFFTHIPKCGGSGIENIFKNLGYKTLHICNKGCGHKENKEENYIISQIGNFNNVDVFCKKATQNIITNPKIINCLGHHVFPRKKKINDIIIASIRNPYDLMLSRWKYHDKHYRNEYTFDEWIDKYAGETLMRFIENCYENGDSQKKMIVDYFIRLENVEEDINNLIKLGYIQTECTQEQIKTFCSIKTNTTKHQHYSSYYNNELKAKVYNSAKPIFDMFEYPSEL